MKKIKIILLPKDEADKKNAQLKLELEQVGQRLVYLLRIF